jgi:hypothetical protein
MIVDIHLAYNEADVHDDSFAALYIWIVAYTLV